jgi:hypothetical protein
MTWIDEQIERTVTSLTATPRLTEAVADAQVRLLVNAIVVRVKDALPLPCKDACAAAIDATLADEDD